MVPCQLSAFQKSLVEVEVTLNPEPPQNSQNNYFLGF
jgi:hypothetical protein